MRLIDGEIVQSEISGYWAGAKSKEEKDAYMDALVAVMDTAEFQKWTPTTMNGIYQKRRKKFRWLTKMEAFILDIIGKGYGGTIGES